MLQNTGNRIVSVVWLYADNVMLCAAHARGLTKWCYTLSVGCACIFPPFCAFMCYVGAHI